MWSTGCLFSGMLFKVNTFFEGKDNLEVLNKIESIIGTEDIINYVERYRAEADPELIMNMKENPKPKLDWDTFVTENNEDLISPEALDLLNKMLVVEHTERITPLEAMKHPYFDALKDKGYYFRQFDIRMEQCPKRD